MEMNVFGARRLYSRPLVSEQRQELGHSVIRVHLDTYKKAEGETEKAC